MQKANVEWTDEERRLAMVKKTKKLIVILTALMMLTIGIPVMAAAIPHAGTERYFESKLPNSYANAYFQTRTKQSNYGVGYVYLISKPDKCAGINAWICDADTNICSHITRCDSLNKECAINYKRNYASGSTVRLGIEDLENTQLFHHEVKGYVNYN